MDKLCPFKFNQLQNQPQRNLRTQADMYCKCEKEKCALWIPSDSEATVYNTCAIVGIAIKP